MKKKLINYLILIGIHLGLVIILYLVFSFLGFIKGSPTNLSISQWDVWWYKSIKETGYSFNLGDQSNVAFFPLFPLLWKYSFLSPIGISILNLIFLFTGVFLLSQTYNIENKKILLIFSIPSLFFCYVPYSEGLFFLAGSLIIYGLKKENWIAILGVSIACLTRSASLVFIPILLFSKLYNFKKQNKRKVITETILLVVFVIISTLLAQYIQYLETGKFFTMFKALEAWDRTMKIPTLYFTTWDEARLIWLDGLGFLIGLTSSVLCFIFIVKKFINNKKNISPNYLFSIGYLALVTFVTVMYSSVDANGGTSLLSLNRYVFSTPFFMVFLIILLKRNRINRNQMILFVSISLITWSLFNAFGELHSLDNFSFVLNNTKIYFGIIFLYTLLFMLLSNNKYKRYLWSGVYLFNLILQIYLFNSFLNGIWIG